MYLIDTNASFPSFGGQHQISAADVAYIAASAMTRRLTIVTRNVKHFAPTNAPIINPWDYPNTSSPSGS